MKTIITCLLLTFIALPLKAGLVDQGYEGTSKELTKVDIAKRKYRSFEKVNLKPAISKGA